ncbi:WD40-repeat-containing domain protein [Lactarius quietus]|nr:WD40-repeat-containing domain protein [Lactarius quietus]
MEVDDTVMPPIEESDEKPRAPNVFIPGVHTLGKDEILEADDSVYIMRHTMNANWPCLSFDVLRDDEGDQRQRFPATAYIVAGSQADAAKKNELSVFKMTQLHRTQKDGESDDEGDDDDDDDNLDEDAVLDYRSVPHFGGVTAWAETGKVHIWDVRPLIHALATPGANADKERTEKPRYTGFAMDWATSDTGALRLLTGDIHSKIYLTTSTPTGFTTQNTPFTSHTSSVEDIQWSPSEATVFASCSADQSVRMWDVRSKGRKSVAAITAAHRSDVNVISWSRSTAYLLLSGGDEGEIKVWDLRNVKKTGTTVPDPTPVASFTWHRFHLRASGADDQVTLWDLAVEQDDEETGAMDDAPEGGHDVPPQLLFVHQGQTDVKEVHWHPQIPGTVISTAQNGFNIFKTISV